MTRILSLIESVKAGKVDIMLGAMGWTKERSKVLNLSDPIYYFGISATPAWPAQRSKAVRYSAPSADPRNRAPAIGRCRRAD
jgi:hypothetical protein